jgi:pimeloyl-ACP methyl ester carboxylesterase
MAARWSALLLAGQLLLAAGFAAALIGDCGLSAAAVIASTLVECCGVGLLLAIAPLLLGRSMARDSAPPRRMDQLLRALCGDALALELALGRMALEPWRPPPAAAADPLSPRPVLLVHGIGCSRAVWRPLLARLRAANVGPVRAVSLEPLLADIESYAAGLLAELEALASRGGGRAVTIVAHSMGGLVARAALRRARAGLIGRIITLGAPHHGTALACRFRWPSARQMCPGSPWITALNTAQEERLEVPMTTLYSLDDNYIFPASSARFRGARMIELQALGHLSLLDSTSVLERVVSELLS